MIAKMLCVFLSVLLTYQPAQLLFASDQQTSVKEVIRASRVREKVRGFGVGALITVKLVDSRKQRGRISDVGEDSFHLAGGDRTASLSYSEVADLSLVNPKYKAKGEVDASRVRQILFDVGVGQQAKLKLISGARVKGDIRSIDKDGFAIFDSNTNKTISIPFKDVTEIEKKGGSIWPGKQLLWIGIGVGVAMLIVGVALAASGSTP